DGGAYDGLVLPAVPVVVVDDDAADFVTVPVDPSTSVTTPRADTTTMVAEDYTGTGLPNATLLQATDAIQVFLTRQPTGTVTIHVTADGQTQIKKTGGSYGQ